MTAIQHPLTQADRDRLEDRLGDPEAVTGSAPQAEHADVGVAS